MRKAGRGKDQIIEGVTGSMLTGNAAPKILRDTVLAARADAAANRYASTV